MSYPPQIDPNTVDFQTGPLLPPEDTLNWSWQNRNSAYLPAPPPLSAMAFFPADQLYVFLQQYYYDGDSNSTSGFLTFWPSDAFTITEMVDSVSRSWRVTQRYCGTQTWPDVDAGVGPWAFSMEESGKIYIYLGSMTVKLFATDNPNLVTDSGAPLTYHVIEHFLGGTEFDISVPGATTSNTSLYSMIVPGSQKPWAYDPVYPMGTPGVPTVSPELPDYYFVEQSHLSTDFVQAQINASTDPTIYPVTMAFPVKGVSPVSGDWVEAEWPTHNVPYVCQTMVGPDGGTISLAPGRYDIWVTIAGDPETPVFRVGTLKIT